MTPMESWRPMHQEPKVQWLSTHGKLTGNVMISVSSTEDFLGWFGFGECLQLFPQSFKSLLPRHLFLPLHNLSKFKPRRGGNSRITLVLYSYEEEIKLWRVHVLLSHNWYYRFLSFSEMSIGLYSILAGQSIKTRLVLFLKCYSRK